MSRNRHPIEPAGAIQRIPTGFLVTMIGRFMIAMAARDRTAVLARFNRWLNGDVDLTPAQVELLEVSIAPAPSASHDRTASPATNYGARRRPRC